MGASLSNSTDPPATPQGERYDLKALRAATTRACDKANRYRGRDFSHEPVNWADFSCTSAQFIVDDDGYTFHRVVIEEAMPGCSKLCRFIAVELKREGFIDVRVDTEW